MGVPAGTAGRLNIEVMADVARLAADIDRIKRLVKSASGDIAAQARAANDNLAGIGRGAGAGIQQFSRDVAALKARLDPAWESLQRYKQQVQTLQQALREGAITHKQYVDQLRQAVSAYQQVGQTVKATSGQARAGMQQLSFQLGDVATQFAAGTPPMMIFAQQGSQVVQAIGLMTNSSKGLIGFIGGPWGQVIMAAVTILGTLTAAYMGSADATDKKKDAAKDLLDAMRELHEATVRESQSTWASIQTDIDKANSMRVRAIEARKAALAELELAKARRASATASADQNVYGNNILSRSMAARADSEAQALQRQISELNKAIGDAGGDIRLKRGRQIGMEVAAQYDKGAAAALKYDRALDGLNNRLRAGKITEEAYRTQLSAITAAREAATAHSERRSRGLSTEAKAAREAAKAYEEMAKWVADTRMEAEGNLQKMISEMVTRGREMQNDMPTFLEQETAAREAQDRIREGQLETEQRLLDVYLQQVDAIRQLGGLFDGIGGILQGLSTGNFMNIGGKMGGILGILGGMDTGVMAESMKGAAGNDLDEAEKIGTTIADHLSKLFRENGEFFQGLKTVLANAALGSTAAGLAGGNKLGGGIGGAIGGFLTGKNGPFGKALEGGLNSIMKGLGSFAGPLGSIAGGLLGGVVGGLFKPAPKYGTSRLYMDEYGQLTGTKAKGNDAAAQRAATSLAGGVGKGLMSIAETLGAKITNVPTNIVLGTFDGKYRVNTEGRGGKMDFKGNSAKGLHNFGDDQQAAIEFAIQKSIEGAVLSGISQASINILKSGQDLQKAIEKATLIEDIPKELQRRLDPVGYAIDELNRKWMKTVDALREGGATSQQMADAQKLYNMELAEAKDNAGEASRALKDFLKSMNMGANSPLSLRDQAANAKSALDPFLAQINAGQAINQDKYLEAAQTYLDIERQMYGSTAKYFEAFDAIQAATNKAIATVDNAAPIRTTSDPFIEQTAAATKTVEANTANTVTLLEKQNGLLERVIQKLDERPATWTGSLRNYG